MASRLQHFCVFGQTTDPDLSSLIAGRLADTIPLPEGQRRSCPDKTEVAMVSYHIKFTVFSVTKPEIQIESSS
jgi:hypothetical protein